MADANCYPNSVMLSCRDTARSVAFYRDVLGFQLKECWPDDKNPLWANLVLGGQSVMLGYVPSEQEATEGCAHGPEDKMNWWLERAKEFHASKTLGVGVQVYLAVDDVDGYYEEIKGRGAEPSMEPSTEFYGIRNFSVADPNGYQLMMYTAVAMTECQSCGMPLMDAEPGQMYCGYCTDESGKLRPYETVLEGTIQGYFMGMQKMERAEAEVAAKEHLAKMPAWAARS
jgi:uncharacterized glyoxalase superfamily protein PhnB